MEKKIIILAIIIIAFISFGGYFLLQYRANINLQEFINEAEEELTVCTMDVKLCPDGSYVGRVGPDCKFTECPDYTVGWNIFIDDKSGFELKYPSDFFEAGHSPEVLEGNCDYTVFPDRCPNINSIVVEFLIEKGGDAKAIEDGMTLGYWQKPSGEKQTLNNTEYCLYLNSDAAMGHVYNYYYYTTVMNQKCLLVKFDTSTTNCDFYLPLEEGNVEQETNYKNCLEINKSQPVILNEIINTFKFNK